MSSPRSRSSQGERFQENIDRLFFDEEENEEDENNEEKRDKTPE